MKKLFTFLFAIAASVGTIFAASGKCGDNLTWNLTDGVLTISGTGTMKNFDYDDNLGVQTPWKDYMLLIKTLSIDEGVTSIGDRAFEGCISLTSVTIPNSVTSIGMRVFSSCSSLTSVTIPNSVTSIGNYAFAYCKGLTSLAIGNNVTTIEDWAFIQCSALTSVIIPNSVTSIGVGAFYGCSSLTSMTIPNSATSIGDAAFYGCSSLTSVTNHAIAPQIIKSNVFGGYEEYPAVDKSVCTLHVPAESVELYKTADVWKDFNIQPIEDESPKNNVNIYYTDKDNQTFNHEQVTLHLPAPPAIEGFVFKEWIVVAGHLEDGISLQAVYEASNPTEAPAVYTNPANPAQKLIRNGNVYVLYGEKIYTMTGLEVR